MSQVMNVAALNFDTLPNDLKAAAIQSGYVLPTYMYDAMVEFLKDVDVVLSDGKTALYTWEFFDIIKKAEDDFNAGKIADLKARVPVLEDFEIDTLVTRSELITHYRAFYNQILQVKSLNEALTADFATSFLQSASKNLLFKKLATKGFWGGIRTNNQADRGADKNFTGLIKKTTDGAGVGGDIPSGNQHETVALTEANAYEAINEHAQLIFNDVDLQGIEKCYYLSMNEWIMYCKGRAAQSNGTVKPGETVLNPDWMPEITFKPQAGLASKNFRLATPASNLKFCVNESPENYNVEMQKVMKAWQMNILASGTVDYGFGKYMYPSFLAD